MSDEKPASPAEFYKTTVFLPKTDFPMRGELPKKEPEILAKWQEIGLYGKIRAVSKGRKKWILHWGPPYANGDIHIGHAFTKSLKDVVNRYHQMLGFDAHLVPGWDCHGLPIEWKIEEQYREKGKDKGTVDSLTFRAECRDFARHWVDVQREGMVRLGVCADWDNPYLTMKNRSESIIAAEIHKFLRNHLLYRGVKPVMWSTVEKTALAEAEVEYHEHKSTAIWVKFPIVRAADESLIGANIVIWTTTPWTIPGNRAIAFGKDIQYGVYRVTKWKDAPLPNQTPLPQSLSPKGEEGSEAQRAEQGEGKKIGERLILAVSLAESVKEKAGIEEWEEEQRFWGVTPFDNTTAFCLDEQVRRPDGVLVFCQHPLATSRNEYDFRGGIPLLPADFVTEDTGTGFVHIAPGHGQDDYALIKRYCAFIKRYNLDCSVEVIEETPEENIITEPRRLENIIPIESAIDGEGYYTDKHPAFAGKQVFANELFKAPDRDANIAVLKALAESGALLAKQSFRHDYPHSWRSKAPVVFRVTPQWFIAMDCAPSPASHTLGHPLPAGEREERPQAAKGEGGESRTLRSCALSAISQTKWFPAQGENRIRAMVEGRPDWCISRQRAWGVPIAIFVDRKTGAPLRDEAVLTRTVEIFEREGSDAWWSRPASDFLGPDYKPEDYEQVFDIVDVWFESGATHAFVLEGNPDLTWPADLYLEGSDQHRGWFQSSLLESCGTRGVAPFKNVLTHGFILDEKGYKMSKSMGNVVAPEEVWSKYGADILRLWAITVDYTEDVPIGEGILKATADIYRRIRNTFRYLLGALEGFTPDEAVDLNDPGMPELERLVLHWLAEKDAEIRAHIEKFDFGKIAGALHAFCNSELSSFYFDIRKDRLYCDRPDLFERRAARTVMARIFDCLVTWLAPILPFTCEEAWSHRPPGVFEEAESVHLRVFPKVPAAWRNPALAGKWEIVAYVRRTASGALEKKRADKTIGSSLEAKVRVYLASAIQRDAIENVDLSDVLIVSDSEYVLGDWKDTSFRLDGDVQGIAADVLIAEGEKCARCWKVLPEVGKDAEHPAVCPRCAGAVKAARNGKSAAT